MKFQFDWAMLHTSIQFISWGTPKFLKREVGRFAPLTERKIGACSLKKALALNC